jgi:hypothetical protein
MTTQPEGIRLRSGEFIPCERDSPILVRRVINALANIVLQTSGVPSKPEDMSVLDYEINYIFPQLSELELKMFLTLLVGRAIEDIINQDEGLLNRKPGARA